MKRTRGWCLPEDLIIQDILPSLPVKSLLRFRCVCKAWRSAISDRRFIQLQRHRSRPNVYVQTRFGSDSTGIDCVLLCSLTERGDLQEYCRLPAVEDHRVVTSSSDIVVVRHAAGYMLSNPATRDLAFLPLGCWYEHKFYGTGLGFVSSLGRYKMVNITVGCTCDDACEVFTVGVDNSWRQGQVPPFPLYASDQMPYVHGSLHMLSLDSDGKRGRLLVLDLETEAWRVMALPEEADMGPRRAFEVRELQGLLCFACCVLHERVDVWLLRDYASKAWTKEFVTDVTQFDRYVFLLEVRSDGKILLEVDDEGFAYYDPPDKSFRQACQGHTSGPIYAENLMPIRGF